MILKFIGIFIVFLVCVFSGFYFGNLDTFRLRELLELKKAFSILKSEIEFAKTPLLELMFTISKHTKNNVSNFFLMLFNLMGKKRTSSMFELWVEATENFSKKCYLSKADLIELTSFGKTLGYLSKEMQARNINLINNYIDEEIKILNTTRNKNKKLFSSLGILFGMLVAVIFV